MEINIDFTAEPTCARFMHSGAFFRLLAGPVGSGKTTTCIFEILRRSMEQEPGPDGIRHTRWAIVRQTLKQLEDTVLKDILQLLKGLCFYKVSHRTVYVEFGNIRSEWLLIPLDDPEDQRRLLSMQLTGAWLSEAIEMPVAIVSAILGRCGRFPKHGATWFGAIGDTNLPSEGDTWHHVMELETPPDWATFIQPGGLEEGAENLNWLTQTPETLKLPLDHPIRIEQGRRYYKRLAANNDADWVTRYVHAKYGNDPSGQAVFKTSFNRRFHTVSASPEQKLEQKPAIEPSWGYPLLVAQDFGRTPCSLICQPDHRGRLLVFEEVLAHDCGLEEHLDKNLLPRLNRPRFIGRPMYLIGDPSGRVKNNHYEENSFDLIKRKGLNAYPAPTNDPDKRLRAVENLLLQQRDGGPALVIDADHCPNLVLALNGKYRFAKRRNGELMPRPDKTHPWSDLADDLQYACLVVTGGMGQYVANRLALQRTQAQAPRRQVSAAGWT